MSSPDADDLAAKPGPSDAEHALLQQLFDRVVDLPASERGAAIDRAADFPESIRQQVRQLLAYHHTVAQTRLMDLSPTDLRAALSSVPAKLDAGAPIGPYVVQRHLASGGNSEVYLARQSHPLERDVALKVLHARETPQNAGRFAAERNTLAQLNHTGIARVFDANVDEQGRCYIAMELVDGAPLTRDALPADPRERVREVVRLALHVGEALAYAHQRGVIHRDVKPANILVEKSGAPKLIDFGLVASAASESGAAAALSHVPRTDGGTPAFMAPEQVPLPGTPIVPPDVRLDVYGLGATMFTLLTGRFPIDLSGLENASAIDVMAAVRDRPRLRLIDGRPTDVPRDVAAIVDRAIARNPDDRYDSVRALCDDLRRWQRREPVRAVTPTWRYVAGRFVARHRVGVAVATTMAALGVVAVAGTAWGLIEARRENARYLLQLEETRAANGRFQDQLRANEQTLTFLMDDLFLAVADEREPAKVPFLDLAKQVIPRLAIRFPADPLTEAQARQMIGSTLYRVGDYALSAQVLEPCERLYVEAGATTHHNRYQVLAVQGWNRLNLNEREEARRLFDLAIATPDTRQGASRVRGIALAGIAKLLDEAGQPAAALEYANRAVEQYGQIPPESEYIARSYVDLYAMRASILDTLGQPGAARIAQKQAADMLAKHGGESSPLAVMLQSDRAVGLLDEQKYAEALPVLQRVYEFALASRGATDDQTLVSMSNLGSALSGVGRHQEAVTLTRQLVRLTSRTKGDRTHEMARARHRLAAALLEMRKSSSLNAAQRDRCLAEALESARVAAELAPTVFGNSNWMTGQLLGTYGYTLGLSGSFDESIRQQLAAREILIATLGADHPRVKSIDARLADARALARATTQPTTSPTSRPSR